MPIAVVGEYGGGGVGACLLAAGFSLMVLAAVGVPRGAQRAAAQAPNDFFYLPLDSEVGDGDDFIIPPDSDVIGLPPGEGDGGLLVLPKAWVRVEKPPDHLPGGNPTPNYAPVNCPRQKPPRWDQWKQLRAVGSPSGFTYDWDCGIWGGAGPTPTYWSQSTGMHRIATVVHKAPNWQDSDPDSSGYINVFDAELAFDGLGADPQDNTEETVGAWVACGPTRSSLTIDLDPDDPDDMMNYLFVDGVPRDGPAPYTVGLTGGGSVAFYAEATGGDPLTGDALTWGWKWDGNLHKFVEHATPPLVYVEPVAGGISDVILTLNVNGAWEGGPGSTTDKVKVNVVGVEIGQPAAFPAVVGVGEELQLIANGAPDLPPPNQATYLWSVTEAPEEPVYHFDPGPTVNNPDLICETAGAYTVKVEYTLNGVVASDESGDIKVVEVESLIPSEGNEFDDGDEDPDTKSYILPVQPSGYLTVTATPNPDVAIGDLPGSWSLTGGQWQDDFHTRVDKTVAARTVVRCSCGTSYKQATIYVATLNLALQGTTELTEEDPGGFVALNDDDDEHDEVVDLNDGYNKDEIPDNADDANVAEDDLMSLVQYSDRAEAPPGL